MVDKLIGNESAGQSSGAEAPAMTDMVFDLEATSVSAAYPFALWTELVRCLPWLKDENNSGILPLRGSSSGTATLLSKRTKLILRIPVGREKQAALLTGNILNVDGSKLAVGKSRERPLQPATTLHAHMVESDLNEVNFVAEMNKQLHAMNLTCNLICDKHRSIMDKDRTINGYGLVVHDLKPPQSLLLQRSGLGGSRHFGCGLFIPFKAITGLE